MKWTQTQLVSVARNRDQLEWVLIDGFGVQGASKVTKTDRQLDQWDHKTQSNGSEFQTVGPATEKVRRPNVIRRQRGTVNLCSNEHNNIIFTCRKLRKSDLHFGLYSYARCREL